MRVDDIITGHIDDLHESMLALCIDDKGKQEVNRVFELVLINWILAKRACKSNKLPPLHIGDIGVQCVRIRNEIQEYVDTLRNKS